jgi:glycerol-3-phosphate dehydrogenase
VGLLVQDVPLTLQVVGLRLLWWSEMISVLVRHLFSLHLWIFVTSCVGTSSKSTKLVHGGVRYLQKAVMELDYDQYKLVREALHERRIFLQTAPYLSQMLPIMLPIYKYWQVPYYWAGCKMYDVLAGKENMETSYLMSKGKALEAFPMLKSDGLVGALVYYDGA